MYPVCHSQCLSYILYNGISDVSTCNAAIGVVLTAPTISLNALACMTSSFFNNVDDAES